METPLKYTTENLPDYPHFVPEGISIEAKFATLKDDGSIEKTYYQFRDPLKMLSVRGLRCLEVYEEFNSRMTKERLIALFDAIIAECNKPSIKLSVIVDLVNKGKERLDWIMPHTELLYQMAAVSYFDDTESIYDFDQSYQPKKIAQWKLKEVDGFFFAKTLSELVPLPNLSREDMESYQRVISQMEEILTMKLEEVSQSV